ncbi:nucleotidyl transferase AbiEii/AbiGii toxin family protein [Zavarzinia sp. CC-PAN008]|uniref:nucleotidyl transferase AbiEii/AbiGii toxin family protein n=1 Tax=Zavarzinia sp. CC-PAN008 TaxID=3243332 RepID=UPI003F74334D
MKTNARRPSHWSDLLKIGISIIDQANEDVTVVDRWTLGGGTALMLQIDHRDSHDIDLFVDDPQVLSYLVPYDGRFDLDAVPADYVLNGTSSLKIAFPQGEIDFICGPELTSVPTRPVTLLGRTIAMETPAEIIAKKIRFRGRFMQPRDIFDLAAVLRMVDREDLVRSLEPVREHCARARESVLRLDRDLASAAMGELWLRPTFVDLPGTARGTVLDFLEEVASAAEPG